MKRFDYCTIIGRNPHIYKKHIDNVLKNAGLPRSMWNFHVIIYKNETIPQNITEELVRISNDNDIGYEIFNEQGGRKNFLANLYHCWNHCQTVGDTPLNVRAGSDQAFNKNAFLNMINAWDSFQDTFDNDKVVLFHNLIENVKNSPRSRHILKDWGTNWDNFDEKSFQDWCDQNGVSSLADWDMSNKLWGAPRNKPGLLSNDRADGASWIQSKALFQEYGPMPPIYTSGRMAGKTGDIGYMEKMRDAGIQFYIIGDSHTYHFAQGERNPR